MKTMVLILGIILYCYSKTGIITDKAWKAVSYSILTTCCSITGIILIIVSLVLLL